MDTGKKLEHVLLHLKQREPEIEHWMKLGDAGRSLEMHGVLVSAGALGRDSKHLIDGLTVAVHLLAKTCAALESRIVDLERKEKQ